MKKKVWIYGAIGAVGSLAIAGFLTINNTFAQTDNSSHELHHPGSNAPVQAQPATPSPGANQMGQMMSGDIDQHFIVMMIPHHQGAVDMAELALTRAQRPEIKQLAEAIIRDQNREIEQLRTWYQAWYGSEVPDMMGMMDMMGSGSSHENMMGNQGMMSGQGMMGNQSGRGMMAMHSMMTGDLEALRDAENFDQEFIRQMIPHHQMAVMMAQMVSNTANKPEIRELVQTIITNQTAEIEQMQQWQRDWYQ